MGVVYTKLDYSKLGLITVMMLLVAVEASTIIN